MNIITTYEPIEIQSIYEEHSYTGLVARPIMRILTNNPLSQTQIDELCSGAVTVELSDGERREYPQYESVMECLYTFTKPIDADSEIQRLRAEIEALRATITA